MLDALAFLLRQAEFDVRAFGSGAALLEAIEAEPKPLRGVFVLDLDMPPMDGDVVIECDRVQFLQAAGS